MIQCLHLTWQYFKQIDHESVRLRCQACMWSWCVHMIGQVMSLMLRFLPHEPIALRFYQTKMTSEILGENVVHYMPNIMKTLAQLKNGERKLSQNLGLNSQSIKLELSSVFSSFLCTDMVVCLSKIVFCLSVIHFLWNISSKGKQKG